MKGRGDRNRAQRGSGRQRYGRGEVVEARERHRSQREVVHGEALASKIRSKNKNSDIKIEVTGASATNNDRT